MTSLCLQAPPSALSDRSILCCVTRSQLLRESGARMTSWEAITAILGMMYAWNEAMTVVILEEEPVEEIMGNVTHRPDSTFTETVGWVSGFPPEEPRKWWSRGFGGRRWVGRRYGHVHFGHVQFEESLRPSGGIVQYWFGCAGWKPSWGNTVLSLFYVGRKWSCWWWKSHISTVIRMRTESPGGALETLPLKDWVRKAEPG